MKNKFGTVAYRKFFFSPILLKNLTNSSCIFLWSSREENTCGIKFISDG